MTKLFYIIAGLLGAWALVDMGLARNKAPAYMPSDAPSAIEPDRLPREKAAALITPSNETDFKPIPEAKKNSPEIKSETKPKTNFSTADTKTAQNSWQGQQVCAAPRRGHPSAITHFGQPVRLNGANLAWSRDAHYARDVGTDYLDMRAFRERFEEIAAAGGNSARWWMHTNGTVTPNIDERTGQVTGLSAQRTDQQVVDQVRAILDAAWAEGILLNITLFSFDLMCQRDRLGAHSAMLNQHAQSYIDNALTPLVRGLKDHPALFAWEIFNESEGMAMGSSFFGDPSLQDCATGRAQPTWVFQRFVNLAAARIHALDPNVKVTTSVGHPRHLKDYTNRAITSHDFSRADGLLDFYQIHWYSEDFNPFEKSSGSYRLDRPIIVGEYGPSPEQNAKQLFKKGYAGAWMWSLTSESYDTVSHAVKSGQVCAPPINKAAIEACLRTKNPACYK